MKPFAVLIFEINCTEFDPLVKINWGRGYAWGRKPKKVGHASIWLHIATEERCKERIPTDLQANCVKLCGPVDWPRADEILQGMKASFDQLGIEYFELTDCDD